jgi:hypothetical protein
LNYCLEIQKVDKFELVKLFPPVCKRADNDVVRYQFQFNLFFGFRLILEGFLEPFTAITTFECLLKSSGSLNLGQHKNMKSLALIR